MGREAARLSARHSRGQDDQDIAHWREQLTTRPGHSHRPAIGTDSPARAAGAEPENRRGVEAADPADLSQGIDSFLGPERPSWTMHYDNRDGLPVPVMTAAAPRPGAHA